MHGSWCMMHDAWSKATRLISYHGQWNLHDAWCIMHYAWCMMHDAWCMMHDAWYMVDDSLCSSWQFIIISYNPTCDKMQPISMMGVWTFFAKTLELRERKKNIELTKISAPGRKTGRSILWPKKRFPYINNVQDCWKNIMLLDVDPHFGFVEAFLSQKPIF